MKIKPGARYLGRGWLNPHRVHEHSIRRAQRAVVIFTERAKAVKPEAWHAIYARDSSYVGVCNVSDFAPANSVLAKLREMRAAWRAQQKARISDRANGKKQAAVIADVFEDAGVSSPTLYYWGLYHYREGIKRPSVVVSTDELLQVLVKLRGGR